MRIGLATCDSGTGPRAMLALDGTLYDLAKGLGDPSYATVAHVLNDWSRAAERIEAFSRKPAASAAVAEPVRFLPPVTAPGGVYCAGANYADHVANMARIRGTPPEPDPHELGVNPWHFLKSLRCLVGHDGEVVLKSEFLDWEVELAAVIGKIASNVSVDEALSYVAGYTVANDLSARDFIVRKQIDPASPFYYDWIGQKCFDGSCPIGPWMVPASYIPDPQNLRIGTKVNGVVKQDSHTSRMLFNTAEQIAYLSTRVTLDPGDIILTGTPAGVGAETGEKLKRGDLVEVEIENIGRLATRIV